MSSKDSDTFKSIQTAFETELIKQKKRKKNFKKISERKNEKIYQIAIV